ncbi:uncharacterized protein LOC125680866 [Ostrea edulis]|uniref:uncharacterized protein LOC125680866 n=1 Tax=Ostrea edulis TaxID=37623 RepID=UPI002094800E|nr:uncharacterized protein LOC125680866 [Ostrea edulis]
MKGTLGTLILVYWMCCAFSLPLHYLIKRNVSHTKRNSDFFDVLADNIFDSTARGRRRITREDITEYYKQEWQYDEYRASEISLRYMEWGDTNGDQQLTREELKIALRNHGPDI